MNTLSIVIPTLNASRHISDTLMSLDDGPQMEVVVVDGGSRDKSRRLAEVYGARVIEAERGRGTQLRAGAEAAAGEWMLFLHADTRLGAGWRRAVREHIAAGHTDQAGVFEFALDDDRPKAERLERMVKWRTRRLGLAYGDQGLLIHRDLYDKVGGYRPIPLMEDVSLIRRIGKRRTKVLPAAAITSATKFMRQGYRRRSLRNLFCLIMYFCGIPPRWIAKVYG